MPVTRRERGDRTRGALVAAALELFGRNGVEATSVDEITSAANVAKGTFYVHFQRKTDVLLERAAQVLVELDEQDLNTGAVPNALEQLGNRVAAVMSAMPRVVMGRMVREIVGNRDEWLRILGERKTLNAVILPFVVRGQSEGTVRGDVSARRLSQALTILWLDAVIGWSERHDDRDLAVDVRRATTLFLDGATT